VALKTRGIIALPDAGGSSFDHGAFDARTRRVFVAHTGRDRVEVIDHDASRHIATLDGFPEAAGVVALGGEVLVTNRGAAGLAWVDAATLKTRAVTPTGTRPNGVAITAAGLAIAACIGDERHAPVLQSFRLGASERASLALPGRPRWCVTDARGERVFLAIREPSEVLAASLPDLGAVAHWPLPAAGAHGMDIDLAHNLLYVACDDGALLEVDAAEGSVRRRWPLAGGPDATFFNPGSGLVHVAIAEPGVVQTIDPRSSVVDTIETAKGAKTTALFAPDRLYVFSTAHGGVLELTGA